MELSEAITKPRVDGVKLVKGPDRGGSKRLSGSLAVTGHHLMFSPSSKESSGPEIWFLHKSIDRGSAELLQKDQPSSGARLTLWMKNLLVCVFELQSYEDASAVARSVEILSNLTDCQLDYPFFYRCPFAVLEDGYKAFTTEQEFARLQIHTDFWRISNVNSDFKLCATYPAQVIVPKTVTDEMLRVCATFREGGRFPVLSYYHKDTKSAVVRCSQPLVGINNRRCKEDEMVLNSLLGSAARGYIIDTRSQNAVQTAKTKGGGWEQEMFYSRWKRVHKALPRIAQLRESYVKLVDALSDGSERWLSRVSSCGWLQHVADVLTCACVVAQCIEREGETAEVPVLVHGGDGLDSTLQVCALVALILDSDCRTIRGFQSLIEREWISAGHPFSLRHAHGPYASGLQTAAFEAPTFVCFLDCVAQIYHQFPCSFEFNEDFLLLLFEHSYASEFGSFLGTCEKERRELESKTKTVSLWSNLNRPEMLQNYVNPYYEPNDAPLWPSVAPQSLQVWERLFLRWQLDWSQRDSVSATLGQWKMQEKDLMAKVVRLRRQLVELEREAQNVDT